MLKDPNVSLARELLAHDSWYKNAKVSALVDIIDVCAGRGQHTLVNNVAELAWQAFTGCLSVIKCHVLRLPAAVSMSEYMRSSIDTYFRDLGVKTVDGAMSMVEMLDDERSRMLRRLSSLAQEVK